MKDMNVQLSLLSIASKLADMCFTIWRCCESTWRAATADCWVTHVCILAEHFSI